MHKFSKVRSTDLYNQEEWKRLAAVTWNALNRVVQSPSPRVLDLGSGTGKHALNAPAHYRYVACDIFAEGRRYLKDGQQFLQCDIEHLPFASESFDAVLLCHLLEHCHDPKTLVLEIRRALRVGGALYLETPNPTYPFFWDDYSHARPYTARALSSLLESAQFELICCGDINFPLRGRSVYNLFRRLGAEIIGLKACLFLAALCRQKFYSYACGRKLET